MGEGRGGSALPWRRIAGRMLAPAALVIALATWAIGGRATRGAAVAETAAASAAVAGTERPAMSSAPLETPVTLVPDVPAASAAASAAVPASKPVAAKAARTAKAASKPVAASTAKASLWDEPLYGADPEPPPRRAPGRKVPEPYPKLIE